mmetsp:Transcript_14135/g.38786  ORF Transcript_14135/g.38786 Transcript_14135/m.38786 type:complete len:215 (+) Transcript_14135:419-1063(+)
MAAAFDGCFAAKSWSSRFRGQLSGKPSACILTDQRYNESSTMSISSACLLFSPRSCKSVRISRISTCDACHDPCKAEELTTDSHFLSSVRAARWFSREPAASISASIASSSCINSRSSSMSMLQSADLEAPPPAARHPGALLASAPSASENVIRGLSENIEFALVSQSSTASGASPRLSAKNEHPSTGAKLTSMASPLSIAKASTAAPSSSRWN